MNETFPVLYILMRNDLESMNSGKAMAQASHAASAFEKAMSSHRAKLCHGKMEDDELEIMRPIVGMADQWKTETMQGFGTVLVLAVNEIQMRTAVDVGSALGFPAEVIHDPTYPLRDGQVTHFLPIDTCAYIFGSKGDPMLKAVVGNFPLHP